MRLNVKELAQGLGPGESRRSVCPKCAGGPSGESSFVVTRLNDGTAGFKCHRASCDVAGVRLIGAPASGPISKAFAPRSYPYPLASPARDSVIWTALRVPEDFRTPKLAARLGVFARADVSNEIVWQVMDYNWSARGHISRTYPDKKIKVWREREGPFYAYHGDIHKPVLWIVEDNVSAALIQIAGGNALALLGTHLSDDGIKELKEYMDIGWLGGRKPALKVALDPDAYDKGIALTRRLTFKLGYDTVAVPLSADPKDLPPDELRAMVVGPNART